MLSALCWVCGSAAKPVPISLSSSTLPQLDEEEVAEKSIEQVDGGEEEEEDDEEEEEEEMELLDADEGSTIEEMYDLEGYDDEKIENIFELGAQQVHQALYKNDPILGDVEEDDLSDLEDFTIRPSDALLVAAHSEEDLHHLNIFVYEEAEENLYIHHDFLLPAFPLCLTWLDYNPHMESQKANLVAVGTFDPAIEIWDLDVVDAVEPLVTLGGVKEQVLQVKLLHCLIFFIKSSKNKKKKNNNINSCGGHESSVLCLSWNMPARYQKEVEEVANENRNILASGSADHTVKIWDLGKESCVSSLTHHKDKVQAVEWHPIDPKILLSGSFDKTIAILDARYPKMANSRQISADVESVVWNNHSPQQFLVSAEDGCVSCFDIRVEDKPLWTIQAHNKEVPGLSYNSVVPGMLATGSVDKSVKVWDLRHGEPECVHTLKTEINVYTVEFYRESPFLLGIGGQAKSEKQHSGENLLVWNTTAVPQVKEKFHV